MLSVSDAAVWAEIERVVPLADHVVTELGPTERTVGPSFDRDALSALARAGLEVTVRYRRRSASDAEVARADLDARAAALSRRARAVLHAAQRHAIDGWVSAW